MLRIQFRRERADTDEIFEYKAGQYVFVCVPEISMLEWHPFSISSSPTEVTVTLHIKVVGDWTHQLRQLTDSDDFGNRVPVDILIDGIGVLSMRSVVTWLHQEHTSQIRDSIDRVHFVWSVHIQTELKTLVTNETSENDSDNFFSAANPRHKPGFHDEIADAFAFDFYVAQRTPDMDSPAAQGNYVHYGRQPNCFKLLQDIGTDAKRNSAQRVAVLLCTSSHTATDIVSTCITLSKTLQVSFDVHIEKFDF
ncbi:Superoxide-generating NADPH oxidase heavy chain subunit A [Phytophthora cinnamomi]|uniref:Superoxide-generating NADPH oxidase heavy chain subunit A n=1 Tax=Phytophthora cinnamomi TaxID=4785 RepID=UPI003559C86D|nr:Superoxide-generating NADPH oxidase heavy chain subunit A [Phytophthora cinnamomi]